MINDWDLTQTNLGRLEGEPVEVAVIPTAAIEPHNRHLPEGQDFLHTTHISRAIAERANDGGAQVIWLPAIPYGVDSNLLDFPLAIHVSQATIDALLTDIVRSLHHHGIRKVLIVNGHGGNDFTPFVRSVQADLDVHIFVCNWWTVGLDVYGDIFDAPEDHAGEMETSVALALYPDLVELNQAGNGEAAPFRFEALRKGWARTSRRFARLNDHCAVGDPSAGAADKGEKYLEVVISRMAQFVIELANSPIDDSFPMAPGT